MPKPVGVRLGGLGLIAAGAVLAWSGVNDPQGGPVQVVKDLLTGKLPTPGVQIGTSPLPAGAAGGLGAQLGQALGNAAGQFAPPVQGLSPAGAPGSAQRVLQVAQSYLGTPYVWAGASHSGMDCSGLVLVAYRDGAGISLPHLATAQMARGRRIPRGQEQIGDLAGWGVPGNYPHIALVSGPNQVIVAPTFGQVVKYETLWESKVPGFGMPDIARIL